MYFGSNTSSAPAATSWVTSTPSGTTRSDISGWVGGEFTTTGSVAVLGLGRWCLSGNSQTHTLYISTPSGGSGGVVLGPLTITCTGAVGFVKAAGTASLAGSTTYVLWSSETSGGDIWYDNQALTVDGSATQGTSAYNLTAGNPPGAASTNMAGTTYVPPTFYH